MTKMEINNKIRKLGIFGLSVDEFDRWFFYNWSVPLYRCHWYSTKKERVEAIWSIRGRLWKNWNLARRYIAYYGYSAEYLKELDEKHFTEIYTNKVERSLL